MSIGKINKKFANKFNPEIVSYNKLPRPHQLAIAHYMAIDGEAWELSEELETYIFTHSFISKKRINNDKCRKNTSIFLSKCIDFYIDKYGNEKFGKVNIPTKTLAKEIFERHFDISKDYKSIEDYVKSYDLYRDTPYHKSNNRWPVILSEFDDEVLEDGWHRFHCYYRRKDKSIPCVFFV